MDDVTVAALRSWHDRAERLLHSWERRIVDAVPPRDPDFVHQAEVVVWVVIDHP